MLPRNLTAIGFIAIQDQIVSFTIMEEIFWDVSFKNKQNFIQAHSLQPLSRTRKRALSPKKVHMTMDDIIRNTNLNFDFRNPRRDEVDNAL